MVYSYCILYYSFWIVTPGHECGFLQRYYRIKCHRCRHFVRCLGAKQNTRALLYRREVYRVYYGGAFPWLSFVGREVRGNFVVLIVRFRSCVFVEQVSGKRWAGRYLRSTLIRNAINPLQQLELEYDFPSTYSCCSNFLSHWITFSLHSAKFNLLFNYFDGHHRSRGPTNSKWSVRVS